MDNDGRDNGFAAGIITGALVGAGLALLFAPKAGTELRGDLNDSLGSVRDAVARRYRALADMAGVELENFEERVDRAAASIESSAREVLDAAQQRRPRPL
jgi:gas vesicle protein